MDIDTFLKLPTKPEFWTAYKNPGFPSSHDPGDVLLKSLMSFAALSATFLVLRILIVPRSIPSQLRISWALKGTSLIHSLLVAPAALYALFFEEQISEVTAAVARFDLSAAAPLNHATSSIAPLIVPITLGYFLFDLALLPFWEGTFKGWVPMIVHHVLSLLAWPLGLVHPACHTFLLLCVSMEASSPFVQLRWFLSQHIGKQSCLYKFNGLIMMLSFFVCRIAVIPHFYWAIYISAPYSEASGLPAHVRQAASLLFIPSVLNVFWFGLMIRGMIQMSKTNRRKKDDYLDDEIGTP